MGGQKSSLKSGLIIIKMSIAVQLFYIINSQIKILNTDIKIILCVRMRLKKYKYSTNHKLVRDVNT